jgi:exonuclease III
MSFSCASANASSLKNDAGINLSRFMSMANLDILTVQETHLLDQDIPFYSNLYNNHQLFYESGTENARGILTLVHNSFLVTKINWQDWSDEEPSICNIESGRLLILNVSKGDLTLSLVCIYAPNVSKTRKKFFKAIATIIP